MVGLDVMINLSPIICYLEKKSIRLHNSNSFPQNNNPRFAQMSIWDPCSFISCRVISHLQLFSAVSARALNEELQSFNDNI